VTAPGPSGHLKVISSSRIKMITFATIKMRSSKCRLDICTPFIVHAPTERSTRKIALPIGSSICLYSSVIDHFGVWFRLTAHTSVKQIPWFQPGVLFLTGLNKGVLSAQFEDCGSQSEPASKVMHSANRPCRYWRPATRTLIKSSQYRGLSIALEKFDLGH
jgi:hypothetical protein